MTDVELIKSKLDIVDFISSFITLKKAGRNFKALCPFHSEKTSSFIVSPERQSWHCFGACATGGDAISFYERWEGIDFLEALKSLAEQAGIKLQKFTPTDDSLLKEKLYAINNFTSDFFHYLLTSHNIGRRALEYLKIRNVKKEIIDTFLLGYAPESWDSLLKYLLKKGFSNQDLETAGLIIRSEKGKYYDRFRGRLMFTLKDHRGKIIGFSGRSLPTRPSLDKGDKDEKNLGAKYINSPETPLYTKGNVLYGLDITKESIKKEGFGIVVEGEFDFLSSFQSGITNVVAIKGSALTENQSLLLKRYAESLSLALDADFAGSEAAKRGIEIAENAGLNVKIIKLLKGKDPAECVMEGVHYWKKSISSSVPIYDFIIDSALNKYDANDISGKKKIADEAIPFLAKIQNPIIASHYVKKLAKALNVTEESIESAIYLFIRKKKIQKIENTVITIKKVRSELLEEQFLTLILQCEKIKEMTTKSFNIVAIEDFNMRSIQIILKLLKEFLDKNAKFDIKLFNKLITPEIAPVFDRAYLSELTNIDSDPVLIEKELEKTAKEIKKNALRRNINAISTKINQMEEDKTIEKVELLNNQIREMMQKLKELET